MKTGYLAGEGAFTKDMGRSVYTETMGNSPTKVVSYVDINSLFPPRFNIIVQTDEFVVYGSGAANQG